MPTVLSKILEENVHWREIVLSECSAFDLLRFAGANRSMRTVAQQVLGRRRVNLLFHAIDNTNCEIKVDENGARRETLSVSEARPKERYEYVPFEERKLNKYFGILIELARHSRIGLLEFRQGYARMHSITDGFWQTIVPLNQGKDVYHVDTLKFMMSESNNELLRFFVPRVLVMSSEGYDRILTHVTNVNTGTHPRAEVDHFASHFGPHGTFNYIGFVCAEELHIDERERKDPGRRQPMEVALPSVRATIINLSPYSRISTLSVIRKVNMWKWGVQPIRWLTCCVGLREDPEYFERGPTDPRDIDEFCARLLETLADSLEMPYPTDDSLPAGVLDHMRRTEQLWKMDTVKMPRAIRVVGPSGHLVIVVRQFTWDEQSVEVRTNGGPCWQNINEVGGGVKPALALGAFYVVD